MTRKPWRFALVQHPMVLVVHEDRGEPAVCERRLPAGAPDLATYADRVRRNLAALQRHPDLKLNYEFSGVELELLAEHAPDVVAAMRPLVAAGKLAFVGGDYSQPHGQIYSGELNFRQLQFGLRVFRELAGYAVSNAFHQETSLHEQMPQLLRAFGFRSACPPLFPYAVTPVVGQPLFVGSDNNPLALVAADCVAHWRGLDGTEMPLVFPGVIRAWLDRRAVTLEEQKDLYRSLDLMVVAPDMDEIEEDKYQYIVEHGGTVLLDQAVEATLRQQPATWTARLYTTWSYAEGEWAEAVTRQIRATETMLLAEESLAATRETRAPAQREHAWKTTLAAMHHDVHWLAITDLKRTYLKRLGEAHAESLARCAQLVRARPEPRCGGPLRVANPLPYARRQVVKLSLPERCSVQVQDANGKPLPTQCLPAFGPAGGTDVFFVAALPGLATADFQLVADGRPLAEPRVLDCAEIQAGAGRYVIASDGTVQDAWIDGYRMLDGPGHELRYIGPDGATIGGAGRRGSLLSFVGPVGPVVRVTAPVGDVAVEIEFVGSPAQPFLEISTRLHFRDASIGVMWEDRSKLNAYWAIAGRRIRHDIPFGAVPGREGLPLFAPSWVSVRGERGGAAILNAGTPKHWRQDGVLGCVLAWGGPANSRMGIDYSSRRDPMNWVRGEAPEFDLRLKGAHTIRHGVVGLLPEHSEACLARIAQGFNSPLLAFGEPTASDSPSRPPPPDLSDTSLVATACLIEDDEPVLRFFEGAGESVSRDELSRRIGERTIVTDLRGQPLDVIGPYRIGLLRHAVHR